MNTLLTRERITAFAQSFVFIFEKVRNELYRTALCPRLFIKLPVLHHESDLFVHNFALLRDADEVSHTPHLGFSPLYPERLLHYTETALAVFPGGLLRLRITSLCFSRGFMHWQYENRLCRVDAIGKEKTRLSTGTACNSAVQLM